MLCHISQVSNLVEDKGTSDCLSHSLHCKISLTREESYLWKVSSRTISSVMCIVRREKGPCEIDSSWLLQLRNIIVSWVCLEVFTTTITPYFNIPILWIFSWQEERSIREPILKLLQNLVLRQESQQEYYIIMGLSNSFSFYLIFCEAMNICERGNLV